MYRSLQFYLLTFLLCLFAPGGEALAQDRTNPFEITSRLPTRAVPGDSTAARGPALTPFDIRRGAAVAAAVDQSARVGLGQQESSFASPAANRSGPLVIQSADPNKGKGTIIAIQLFLLVALASLWVLFGGLLRQCIRGTVNESLMNQIYTRRSGGEETALWICYLFFFLAAGFFTYLLTTHLDISLGLSIWASWLTYSLLIAGAVGLKQWVVWAIGRLFPIRKEASRYAFVVMVFSILAGVALVPINLGVSYAPEGMRVAFLYGGIAMGVLIYFLHFARGIFIIGSAASQRPVHLLLYICAIEIAPLLLVYRYLDNSLI